MKPAEGALYERLFRECDPTGSGLVSGSAVKPLFSRAKLNNKILAGIWTLADKGKRKALDMANWAVALRLVALAQSGLPVSELGLKQYTDVPLPVFEGFQPQHTQPPPGQQLQQQQQQQPGGGMGGAGPSDMASFPPASGPPSGTASPPNGAVVGGSEWSMSADERAQYVSQFSAADEDQDGYVGGKEAQSFFTRSGLDKKSLRQIWLLADYDKDNKLSVDEFSIAMHLVLRQRKGQALPAQLPEALVPNKRPAAASAAPDLFGSTSGTDTPPSFGAQTGGGFGSFGELGSTTAPLSGSLAMPPPAVAAAPLQSTNFFPNGSAAAFLATPEDEMEKYRDLTRISSTAQSSIHRANDQLKGLHEVLNNYSGKFRSMMEQVAKTGADYDNLQLLIAEEQAKIDKCKTEMAKLDDDNGGVLSAVEKARQQLVDKQLEYKDVQQQILSATQSIPSIKKETQELDMQIAVVESQLTQVRQQWKQTEDMKAAQASILQGRKDQAGKLLREKAEVQEMLDQAQLELSKMKNEGQMVKEHMPTLQGSIKDMRDNLAELSELVAEERKNPSARTEVQVGQNGQLVLGAAQKSSAGHSSGASKSGSLGGGKSAAAALGLDDEDDAFAVPDLPMPGASSKSSLSMPPAAASSTAARPSVGTTAAKSIFGDDDDAFAVPDIGLPAPATTKAATAAGGGGGGGAFDAFDFAGPAASGGAASKSSAGGMFGEADWGADPFGGASTSASSTSNGGGSSMDPFGSASFGAAPGSNSTPPSTPAPPAAAPLPPLGRAGSLPQPPPPPPSAAPPAPKAAPSTVASAAAAPPTATPPAQAGGKAATALAGFDDDGWDVPAAVPGSDVVKATGDGWGTGDESSWGF